MDFLTSKLPVFRLLTFRFSALILPVFRLADFQLSDLLLKILRYSQKKNVKTHKYRLRYKLLYYICIVKD